MGLSLNRPSSARRSLCGPERNDRDCLSLTFGPLFVHEVAASFSCPRPVCDGGRTQSRVSAAAGPAQTGFGPDGRWNDCCYRSRLFGVFLSGALLATVLLSGARAGDEPTLPASGSSRASSLESLAPFITEASRRFASPTQRIRGVMQRESSADGRAISPKGALGLMQMMPGHLGRSELPVRIGY